MYFKDFIVPDRNRNLYIHLFDEHEIIHLKVLFDPMVHKWIDYFHGIEAKNFRERENGI